MHVQTLARWQHHHNFSSINEKGEQRTSQIFAITAITMVVEIIAGVMFGSMALLADGFHMGTHVAAFTITLFAYKYANKHKNNTRFTFGTGKVSVLGGFTSAIVLAVVAFVMSIESIQRIHSPQEIHFTESISVAIVGLLVNIVCVFLLQGHEDNDHKGHHDHNLKAAYLHVLADSLTSLLAIVALLSGKLFAWNWLDPIMGIVGAVVITHWAYGLLRETGPILLDENVEKNIKATIEAKVETDSDNRIADLHLWRVGSDDYAVIISLVTHFPKPVEYYREILKDIHQLSHITIEVNQCLGEPCIVPKHNPV